MSGEAFGLGAGVNLLARHPRTWCPDCGARLLWDAAALGVFANPDLPRGTRDVFARMLDEGGSVYGCEECGLVGGFGAVEYF